MIQTSGTYGLKCHMYTIKNQAMIKIKLFSYQKYLQRRKKKKTENLIRGKIISSHIAMKNLCLQKSREKIKEKKFRNKLDKTLKDLVWYERYLQGIQKR